MIAQTAKVIAPTTVTDAMLTSSTAPENDYAAYAGGTTYALGAHVILTSTHRIYESLQNGNTGHSPELAASSTWWLDIGPTNRWAMLDDVVGTSTTLTSPLTVVLNPGPISGLALMELVGSSVSVTLKDEPGGTTIYSATVNLDDTVVDSFYDWFFNPYVQRTTVIITDLPWHYFAPELTISITGTGTVSCGVCKFGEAIGIGGTTTGATAGIIDYSVKSVDVFGRTSITRRAFSKRSSIKIVTDKIELDRIFARLSALRATPAVWIATEATGFSPLLIYGFFKDFSIEVAYSVIVYCSLEIEGLI